MTRLLLVGCTASGRTSVGSALAERLGWPYLDDDVVVERTAGVPPRALHEREGADALRATTRGALTLLLGVPGPVVMTVPSSSVLEEGGPDRLRGTGHVVWLRTSAPVLARRARRDGGTRTRPWLAPDPAAALGDLVERSDPLHAALADQVVDTDVLPVGAVARAVVAGLPPG